MDANSREWLQRYSGRSFRMTLQTFRALKSAHENNWFFSLFFTFTFIRGSDLFSTDVSNGVDVPICNQFLFTESLVAPACTHGQGNHGNPGIGFHEDTGRNDAPEPRK